MKWSIIAIVILLAGCASPVNERTATNYYQAGEAALAQGNLTHAREMFSRALINARLGNMGERTEARILSKLGRVYGNLCEHETAEKVMLEARDLNMKAFASNPVMTFPARSELAQFYYDIGRYDRAVTSFEEALAVGGNQLKQVDPVTYNAFITDYADALVRTGRLEQSKRVLAEVKALETASVRRLGKGTEYVRYPKSCK